MSHKIRNWILSTGILLFAATFLGAEAKQEIWYPPKTTAIKAPMGPFIRLDNGEIMTVTTRDALFSKDEGNTWRTEPLFSKDDAYELCNERLVFQTKSGAILVIFANLKELKWKWDSAIRDADKNSRLPTYVMRSADGGKTWSKPHLLHTEWTGASRDILQTRSGKIVFTTMMILHDPGRHATITYSSDDDGVTWRRSNIIDLGGIGNHDGAMEATIEELKNGRIWMLLRTNWDYFWEAFSDDGGVSWRSYGRSEIKASAAPGLVHRLADGRLILVWNQLYPEGKTTFKRWGGNGQWSESPSNIHRTELSIAVSSDEGNTWSEPIVIGRVAKGYLAPKVKWQDISYPFIFEIQPGILWITTMRGGYAAQLKVDDFLPVDKSTAKEKPKTIVAFGDSTTAPRKGLTPYPALLENSLKKRGGAPVAVINAGKPGDTTASAMERFQEDVLSKNPDIAIIQFGINDMAVDVWKEPPAKEPRLPVADYEANLRAFVDSIRKQGGVVILMTPNPMEWSDSLESRYNKPPYDLKDPQSLNKLLKPYADAMRRVAAETNVYILDIAQAYASHSEKASRSMLLDGIHPNQEGHDMTSALLHDFLIKNELL